MYTTTPIINQYNEYSLASISNPKNTIKAPINANAGKTGYSGILNPGTGKSLPSRGLNA